MNANITRKDNEILVNEKFDDGYALRGLLSAVHKATTEEKLSDVVLNFKHCSHVEQGPMVFLCAQILKHRKHGIGFALIAPESPELQRLFRNTNWAHFIDPRFDPARRFEGLEHLPATQYRNLTEQSLAVDKIVKVIWGAILPMGRRSLAAFEWSINEITGNVLSHADSPVGGLVQVQTFPKNRKAQFVVADAGVGILKTLRKGHPTLTHDVDALEEAICEGVTSDKSKGQGNGLYGSAQMCLHGESAFELHSGYASLIFVPRRKKPSRAKPEGVPCDGTLVAVTIDFSKPKLLEEALRFQGRKHEPLVDFVETQYEQSGDGDMCFKLVDESQSFGSRVAGKPVRTKLLNLYGMHSSGKISIDLSNVPIMSSSFADEVFGKLFFEVGAVGFMRRFELMNVEDIVRHIIDKAIAQRVSTGIAD
ncbi:MAG: STAS-like domain-containing protein [Nitrospira sp.]|nr:STAS-like domain-containing protein [Nitrospira sp.]